MIIKDLDGSDVEVPDPFPQPKHYASINLQTNIIENIIICDENHQAEQGYKLVEIPVILLDNTEEEKALPDPPPKILKGFAIDIVLNETIWNEEFDSISKVTILSRLKNNNLGLEQTSNSSITDIVTL